MKLNFGFEFQVWISGTAPLSLSRVRFFFDESIFSLFVATEERDTLHPLL